MLITLYKNCVVRDTYSRVFSPDVFEDYLATLENTNSFEIESSYSLLSGSLTFDWAFANAESPFVYNYAKIEDDVAGVKFYAFINRLDLANGCVVMSYTTDIWHTYIGGCRTYDSLINQSKHAPTGKYHFLPIDYLTNRPLTWNSLEAEIGPESNQDKVCLVFEIQFYQLESSQQTTDINPRNTFIAFSPVEYTSTYNAQTAINQILGYQGRTKLYVNPEIIKFWNVSEGSPSAIYEYSAYFEIVNIFMIRKSWLEGIQLQNDGSVILTSSVNDTQTYIAFVDKFDKFEDYTGPVEGQTVPLLLYILADTRGESQVYPSAPKAQNIKEVSIPVDYKIVSIGNFTTPTPAQNNGISNNMRVMCSFDLYNFHLYLNVYGQLFDITELYKVEVPYTVANAETNQLRRLADYEKKNKAISKIVSSSVGLIGDLISTWSGSSGGSGGSTPARIGQTISKSAQYGGTLADNLTGYVAAVSDKYQSNYASDVESVAAMNVYYGLGYFTFTAVDNQEEVDFAIDNYGYSMGVVPTTDLPYNPFNLESGYNPTSYSQINLYGSCPQSILNQLEGILTKGTKIYYEV